MTLRSVLLSTAFVFLALAGSHSPAAQAGEFTLGVEGFHDNYKEPDPDIQVDTNANFGGITAGYELNGHRDWFADVNGRFDYGKDNYKSVDGVSKGVPQYEAEFQGLLGLKQISHQGSVFKVYTGVGARLFWDDGDGTSTSLGFGGYDRRIQQVYIPFGISDQFSLGRLYLRPTAEFDDLVWGRVYSHLAPYTGFNITNTQNSGWGLRGELMLGQKLQHYSWEAGPFIRYWKIDESSMETDPSDPSLGFVEPDNNRTQVGGIFRLKFR